MSFNNTKFWPLAWRKEDPQRADDREALAALLRWHDWYYNMSDDHRVWSNGQRHWDLIQRFAKKLGEEGQRMVEEAFAEQERAAASCAVPPLRLPNCAPKKRIYETAGSPCKLNSAD